MKEKVWYMAIKIVTDSSADYDLSEIEEKGITLVPITFCFGSKAYRDGYDITKDEFFSKLVNEDEVPKTAQPSPQEFVDVFERAKENADTVIAILLSGALSGTVQSAMLAKDIAEYDDIFIIDGASASVGLKILVDKAVEMADSGYSAQEIVDTIEAVKKRAVVIAVLDTLDNLCSGGRLTKTQASLGTLANIKPVIKVGEDGSVALLSKNIGKSKAMKKLINEFREHPADSDYPVYVIYSYQKDNCLKMYDEMIEEGLLKEGNTVMQIGGAIGTHIGPGAFGLAYVEAFNQD